jgi:serine protease AprX
VPLTVQFTDTSTGTPTAWSWSFGDGGTSSSRNPSHQYMAAGTYTVSLTATNSGGSNTATKSGYITVANALALSLSADKVAPRPGDVVAYTISYSNTGQVTLHSIQIVDPIPLNTTYASGSASSGGSYDGTKITWNLGSLAPGASGTVTFRVTVN